MLDSYRWDPALPRPDEVPEDPVDLMLEMVRHIESPVFITSTGFCGGGPFFRLFLRHRLLHDLWQHSMQVQKGAVGA